MRLTKIVSAGLLAGGLTLLASDPAEARLVIKNPNAHPDYTVELEPHATMVLWGRQFGGRLGRRGRGFTPEFGAGFRASIELADPAFIPKLNNTVAISFGIDLTNCRYCDRLGRDDFSIWTPVTLQWNFFLTEKWSVFPDLGLTLRSHGFYRDVFVEPIFMIGGRYHFNDDVALTFRIGYPFLNVGVSFFAG